LRTGTTFLLDAAWGAAEFMIIERTIFLLVFAMALGYAVVHVWRRRNGLDAIDGNSGFRPQIGFTRLDGMVSLSLLLENESDTYVWVEEIEIFLGGLRAEEQATEPSFRGIQKIRQLVHSGDTLPISLCETIYKAAGNPQREHTCVMSSVLRYRIGEEQFEKTMENYRLRMIGLTVSSIRRERKRVPTIQIQEESQSIPAMAMKLK
jgi:hypothetical protein